MSIPELTGLLIDSKEQFTTRLTEVVSPFVINTIDEIHMEASKNESWTRGHMYQFQKILKGVPKWNSDIIDAKTNEILASVPWFNDLIAAAIVTQTKVLSSIRLSSDMPDVKLKIPDSTSFVSTMYSEIARILYYNPNVSTVELERVIYEAIERTIRKLIPFQDILESYLATGGDPAPAAENSSSSSDSSDSSSDDDDNDDNDDNGNLYRSANQHVENLHQNLNIDVPAFDQSHQSHQSPYPHAPQPQPQTAFDSDDEHDENDEPDPRAGALGSGHTFQPPPPPQPPQPPPPPQLFSPGTAPAKLVL